MNGKAIEYFTACTLGPDLFARNCIQRIGFAVFRTEKVVVIGKNGSCERLNDVTTYAKIKA